LPQLLLCDTRLWERPKGATQQPVVEQARAGATLAESPAAGKIKSGIGYYSLVVFFVCTVAKIMIIMRSAITAPDRKLASKPPIA